MRLTSNKKKTKLVVIIRIAAISSVMGLCFYLGKLKGEWFGFDVGYVTGVIHTLVDPDAALANFDEIKKRHNW